MELILEQGNLSDLLVKLRKIYPELTDADIFSSDGNINEILRKIGYKIRKTKQELQKIFEGL